MDWDNLIFAILGGGLAGSALALFFNRRNTKADTFLKLATTVNSLSSDLETERQARRKDNAWFESELVRIKNDYQDKIERLEERVNVLEAENHTLKAENHALKQQLGN